MGAGPTATITFLFTDIEGSTRLWEQHPEAMEAALARHDLLAGALIEQHNGRLVKHRGEGDSLFAVFARGADAVAAATALQRALHVEPWPAITRLRVRMALHTGEAVIREGDYLGPAVNRCARLRAVAHGGQVLLSRAAVEAVGDDLPAKSELCRLGTHRLRDVAEAEAIYQLVAPGLPSAFPPLGTLDVAFRRGVARAAAIAGVVLAVVSGLAATAVWQAHRADRERSRAEWQAAINRRERYDAQMNLAGQALEAGNLDQARALIDRQSPGPGEEDLRGFAWRYLRQACQGDERFTLAASKEPLTAVAVSPDGRLLAAGGDDKAVRLWDLTSRRLWASLPQGDRVNAVAFSPNGQDLAAGTVSGQLNLWDVAARREIRTFRGSGPGGLAFSPDGQTLAAGSGRVVQLWKLATGRVIATLPGEHPRAQSTMVAFSPDGRRLAYAFFGDPTTVKLWDRETKQVTTLRGHTGFIFSAGFSPDGKTLATGSGDNTVRLWNVATGQTVGVLKGLAGVVWGVAFSPDGHRLATASGDDLIRLWDLASQRQVRLLKGHRSSVSAVAFTPDGKWLASCSEDHTVKLWSVVPLRDPNVLRGHREWVWSVAFSPDGKRLASAGTHDGMVKLWDVGTGREVISRKIASDPGVAGMPADAVFSPDGRYLAVCGDPAAIQLWDAAFQHEVGLFRGHGATVNCIAFSPDAKLLASSGEDDTIRLWELATRREVARFSAPADINGALLFSRDGRTLAWIGGRVARLWNVRSRRAEAVFRGYPINGGLAFDPDGRELITGGNDGALRWWDIVTGRVTATVPGHPGRVMGMALSPNGRELATVGDDDTVRLWDPVTHQQILVLRGHEASLRGVAFSPDGNTLATSGADRTVRLWRAPPFTPGAAPGGERAPRSAAGSR